MLNSKTTLASIAALLLGGCNVTDNSVSPQGAQRSEGLEVAAPAPDLRPQMPQVRARVEPSDLMTSTMKTVPTVLLGTDHIDEAQQAELLARTRLVLWPEGEPVPGVQPELRDARDVTGMQWSTLALVPDKPLEHRWYAIEVAEDALSNLAFDPQGVDGPDGTTVVRFHPGSQPVVRRIQIAKDDRGMALHIVFSERVHAQASASELVTLMSRGQPVGCKSDTDEQLHMDEGTDTLTLVCEAINLDGPLEVTFDRRLVTMDGAGLGTALESSAPHFKFVPSQHFDDRAGEVILRP